MSRTYKDESKVKPRSLVISKNMDGTFDLSVNRALSRSQMSERSLQEELCVRYGYCADELDPIMRDLNRDGRKEIFF
jgi:hypothetical protein